MTLCPGQRIPKPTPRGETDGRNTMRYGKIQGYIILDPYSGIIEYTKTIKAKERLEKHGEYKPKE